MDAKTGSSGLILKMVEAGEETFCGKVEIQGVFEKRVDSFSRLGV